MLQEELGHPLPLITVVDLCDNLCVDDDTDDITKMTMMMMMMMMTGVPAWPM